MRPDALIRGPIALIDAEMPVGVIATQNGLYEKVLSNIQEIKARKGKVIAFVTKGDRKSTRLNSSHASKSRMPSSA